MNSFVPSEKQKEYLEKADRRYNFKTGATRSGKSYLDTAIVIMERIMARVGLPGLVVLIGVTKATLERNVLEPMRDIYGEDLVGYINSQNIAYMFGEKVYCLGAEKASQVSKIRGSSIKYCYGDEVADWNEDVFEILKSRLDKSYSCFDGSLNPQGPNHWLKEFLDNDKIDKYVQQYTIFDNPYLPEEVVKNLCLEYAGTVFYKRYILGEWAIAEGLVYPSFKDSNILTGEIPKSNYLFFVAVDYGTVNPFAVNVYAYDMRTRVSIQIAEGHWDGRKMGRADDEAYYKYMKEVIGELPIQTIVIDPSAASFIETIVKYGEFVVERADNDVINGIQMTTKYINRGLLKIHESCVETRKELLAYSWDDKAIANTGKEAVLKVNDHHMDAMRYYIYTIMRKYNAWVI